MSNGAEPISRRVIREAIAAGLQTSCESAQAVYAYGISDFQGRWPLVRVMSRGSERPPMTAAGIRSRFAFLIDIWVLFKGPDWTEQAAENALDAIEQEVISWLTENQGGELWTNIYYNGPSAAEVVKVAGEPWLTEAIQVIAEVYG